MDGEQDQQAGAPLSPAPAAPIGLLSKLTGARPEELPLVLTAMLCAFCLFCRYSLAKPLRDAVSAGHEKEWVASLLTGTLIAMLGASVLVGVLVSRLSWRRFVLAAHALWVLGAIGLAVWFKLHTSATAKALDSTFFIAVSVFNLLSVSIFWSTVTDIFASDRAKAVFPAIGLGLTAGNIAGSWTVSTYGKELDASTLVFASAALLAVSGVCAAFLLRGLPSHAGKTHRTPGGSITDAIEGLRLALRSDYLGRLAFYVLLYSVTGTLVWMQQQAILKAEFQTLAADTARSSRAQVSGTIDFYANVVTAILQLFIAGRILRFIGVSTALALTPLTTLASLLALYFSPTVAMLIPVQVARRGIHYAIDRPAREVLYTVVSPQERYKSKNLIDTFVYRFGDAVGGWSEALVTKLGMVASLAAFGTLCLGFAGIGVSLGQSLRKRESMK
jgi:AAA family ATP:ADP antiporter